MKDKVKVSLVQFAPVWLDRHSSAKRMKRFAEEEAAKGSELIVFPELCNVGYITPVVVGEPPSFDSETTAAQFASKYIKASEPVPGPTTDVLEAVTRKYGVYIVVGISQIHPVVPATLLNSAVLVGPSGLVGIHHKMHIPADERSYFYPGNTVDVYRTDLGNLGMLVCYDGRFPEPSRILALKGAEIICALSASPRVEHQYPEMDKYRADCRAQENGVYFIACNRSGKEGNTVYLGHSAIAKPGGGIIASSESENEEVITAELYNEEIIAFRSSFIGVFRDRRPEMYSLITEPILPPLPYVPLSYGGAMSETDNRGQAIDQDAGLAT
ncbi:carbon-nitrogen hydrolase family protein [Chloroflexota bacterium]